MFTLIVVFLSKSHALYAKQFNTTRRWMKSEKKHKLLVQWGPCGRANANEKQFNFEVKFLFFVQSTFLLQLFTLSQHFYIFSSHQTHFGEWFWSLVFIELTHTNIPATYFTQQSKEEHTKTVDQTNCRSLGTFFISLLYPQLMKINWKLIRKILGNWYAKAAGYWLPNWRQNIFGSFTGFSTEIISRLLFRFSANGIHGPILHQKREKKMGGKNIGWLILSQLCSCSIEIARLLFVVLARRNMGFLIC